MLKFSYFAIFREHQGNQNFTFRKRDCLSHTHTYIWLNNIDIFYLHIFVLILSSRSVNFNVSGRNWFINLPELIGSLILSAWSWAIIRGVYIITKAMWPLQTLNDGPKSCREYYETNYGGFINQFPPDSIKSMWQFEKINSSSTLPDEVDLSEMSWECQPYFKLAYLSPISLLKMFNHVSFWIRLRTFRRPSLLLSQLTWLE